MKGTVIFLFTVLSLGMLASPLAPADTIVVDTNNDVFDVAHKTCADVTIPNLPGMDGKISLREAICASNNTISGTPNLIHFNIGLGGVQTISVTSALPDITRPVTIDGSTQPGYSVTPVIVLNGLSAGAGVNGLNIQAFNTTIYKLVIQLFKGHGIFIKNRGNAIVRGCYIGTDVNGGLAKGNGGSGIYLRNAWNNTIGGTAKGHGNLISGNRVGVTIFDRYATGNLLEHNYIGVNHSGTLAIPNKNSGVAILGSPDNDIGMDVTNGGNLISGNGQYGVYLFGEHASNNRVRNNKIGTSAGGNSVLGNLGVGVFIEKGSGNIIGGGGTNAGNLISGNGEAGVAILQSKAQDNHVEGNKIGVNLAGNTALGNGANGVIIVDAGKNWIGGGGIGEGNLISGNDGFGVLIQGAHALYNTVLANIIGADVDGLLSIANTYGGIKVMAGANTIGGQTAGDGNLISGNDGPGVELSTELAVNNLLEGNNIGLDAPGTAKLGNLGDGVIIWYGSHNEIGSTRSGVGNVISGNQGNGVQIYGSSAHSNIIVNNKIGTNSVWALNVGNASNGILIAGAYDNWIGWLQPSAPNTIIYNGADGVTIVGLPTISQPALPPGPTGNRVLENAIYSNPGLGIDLGNNGVTPNDAGDPDTGANELQNYPSLSFADGTPFTTMVGGSFNSLPSTQFTLQFFANASCNPSGFGEGELFMGVRSVNTDGAGNVSFLFVFNEPWPVSYYITATATDPSGNTSEFSACQQVLSWIWGPIVLR